MLIGLWRACPHAFDGWSLGGYSSRPRSRQPTERFARGDLGPICFVLFVGKMYMYILTIYFTGVGVLCPRCARVRSLSPPPRRLSRTRLSARRAPRAPPATHSPPPSQRRATHTRRGPARRGAVFLVWVDQRLMQGPLFKHALWVSCV